MFGVTVVMLPKLDYLPDGNRNLVIGFLLPPPGYNLDTMTKIASRRDATRPLWSSDDGPSETEDGRATMSRFFFVAFAPTSSSARRSTRGEPAS